MSTRCSTCDGVGTVSGTRTHPGEMTPRHEKCPDCAPGPAPELSAELQVFVDDFAGGVCDATCADAFSRLVDYAASTPRMSTRGMQANIASRENGPTRRLTIPPQGPQPPPNEWDGPTPEPEPVEDFAPKDTL